jgi:hypothetical protein
LRISTALAVALLCGCNGGVPRPDYPHQSVALALTLHRLTREQVQTIQAEARVDQRGDSGRVRGTVLMFVERPSRLRLDVMTQFGPAAILTIDGDQFAYHDLREGLFQRGRTCPRNIARLLSLPMTVEQATPLLLGGTAIIAHRQGRIEWNEGGFYRIELLAADGHRQVVDLGLRRDDLHAHPERQRLRLLRSEIFDPAGSSVWRATYGDYRIMRMRTVGIAMPFEVRVEQDSSGTDTLVKFKEIRFQAEVPDEAFHQTPRAGTTEDILPCD